MNENKSKNLFWSSIGKFAGLLSVIWILLQLYNYFFKDNYRIKATGNHYKFEYPTKVLKDLMEYNNILAVDSARKVFKDKDSFKSLLEFKNYKEKAYMLESYNNTRYYNLNNSNYLNYRSFWTFDIENRGKKPIEELKLEVPLDGFYKIIRQNQPVISGLFSKQINLADLQPSYIITVSIWSMDDLTSFPEYNEEKTRITHKYGWTKIIYSREVRGIIAWDIRNNNTFLILSIIGLIVLFIILFIAGMNYAPIFQEQERKRKLEELKEMEKIRLEEETKTQDKNQDGKLIAADESD